MTNDEEGLRGCWFAGTVDERAPGHALVAELEDDEAPGEPLREWFPLPPGVPGAGALGGEPDDGRPRHVGPGFVLRPQPSATVRAPLACGSGRVTQADLAQGLLARSQWLQPAVHCVTLFAKGVIRERDLESVCFVGLMSGHASMP